MAILCDHCDNWIHIKCSDLDKLDYEMLESTADPWLCISCTLNILPFYNRHGKAKIKIIKNIKSKNLSLFHHNICSLSKNFDQLHALLTELDTDFDFIGIAKRCISKTDFYPTNIALANYAIEQTATHSNAGGALLYINRKHSYKI